MKVIIFDIYGKFAHFRKFFTNSSSLSYSVPPRTTIAGMLAAILGMERDSYYEDFSKEKLHIAVKKKTKTRKIMQTLNYIKATGNSELVAPKEHTQIPFEILVGEKHVSYRVYVSYCDESIMDELLYRIQNQKFVYPLYLGVAPFSAGISFVAYTEAQAERDDDYIEVSTLINQKSIAQMGIDIFSRPLALVKEKMPTDFYEQRRIKEVSSYIYDENGELIKAKIIDDYFRFEYQDQEDFVKENILFL